MEETFFNVLILSFLLKKKKNEGDGARYGRDIQSTF